MIILITVHVAIWIASIWLMFGPLKEKFEHPIMACLGGCFILIFPILIWAVPQIYADWSIGEVFLKLWLGTFILVIPTGFLCVSQGWGEGWGSDAHGSATFMSKKDIKLWKDWSGTVAGEGLILGRDPNSGEILRYQEDSHLITIASTRSGKGVSTIIPNLLTYEGSTLVIDPKGENARVTARQRANYGNVHVLDPFGVTGISTASYNPLMRIHAGNEDVNDDAASLADALVVRGEEDTHWDDEAASLLEGIILFVGLHETHDRKHLGTVREIITMAPTKFEQVLTVMQGCGGLVERSANRHLSKADREASSVLSTAQRHTKFLDSARMQKVLGAASGLSFSSLKINTGTSIYLCLPPDRFDAYKGWLRLMVNEAVLDMAQTRGKPEMPVLFLLDEFSSLGPLQSISRAMGLMAGYGMLIWPFLQDRSQLTALYGKSAQTFFANAGAVQWFGINDLETAKELSETIGDGTEVVSNGESLSQHARRVATPDELMKLPEHLMVVMQRGQAPALIQKVEYYSEPEFSGLWDDDPERQKIS